MKSIKFKGKNENLEATFKNVEVLRIQTLVKTEQNSVLLGRTEILVIFSLKLVLLQEERFDKSQKENLHILNEECL